MTEAAINKWIKIFGNEFPKYGRNNIVELENSQVNINQLKAARHLYTKAGRYSISYMVFLRIHTCGNIYW